jgi:peptidoglycan/xylan/chitin deacetylase (PgdA/CDA1 family)
MSKQLTGFKKIVTGVSVMAAVLLLTTGSAAAATPATGYASVTLDDGWSSQFDNARPVLNNAGIKATFYIISNTFGWDDYMTADQVKQLAADGHEIGNHTVSHPHLTQLDQSQVTDEFGNSQATLIDQIGVTPTTCAYPYGESNETVQAIAAGKFTACRSTDDGQNDLTNLNRYNLAVFNITSSTTADQVRAAAEQAMADHTWVIFVYHGVGTVNDEYDTTAENFAAQIDALTGTGITIQPVNEVLTQAQ